MSPASALAELLAAAAAETPPASVSSGSLLREQVYARIRGWILDGLLPPETRLSDQEIADALHVSRTPVREAIRRLVDEGLVVAEASRWTQVAPVDGEAADRIYPLVWTLERLALDLGGPWDRADVEALAAANERLATALEEGDPRAALDADTVFHNSIAEHAGNPELNAIMADLRTRLRRIELAYFGGAADTGSSLAEHQRAIDALAAGRLDLAAAAVEDNWRASLARFHACREHPDDPAPAPTRPGTDPEAHGAAAPARAAHPNRRGRARSAA